MPEEPSPPPPHNPPAAALPRPVIPIDPQEPPATMPPPLPGHGEASTAPGPILVAAIVAPPVPQDYPPAPPPPTAGNPYFLPQWNPPVDYRTAGTPAYSRPAFVTSLAIFGILTAALSLLASLFTGCASLAVLGQAQRSATMAPAIRTMPAPPATAPAPAIAIATPSFAAIPVSPNGLPESDAAVIVNVLRSRMPRAMTTQRQRQLDSFLAEHGRLLLDDPSNALTSRKVYDHLGETGEEFAGPGQRGADFFVVKAGPLCKLPGRLRVFDDRAVYEPDDHSPALRSAVKPLSTAQPDPDEEFVASGLSEDSARAVVSRVRQLSNNTLNPAQAATLMAALQSPAHAAWVTPSSTIPGLTAQAKSAVLRSDGSVAVTFLVGKVTLDAQGNMVGGPPVGTPATAPAGGMPPNPFASVSVSATHAAMAVGEAALSAALAIFLLVVAILSLRQRPGVRRLYLIYAVAKLICGVVAVVAFAGILSSLSAGADNTGYAQSFVTVVSGTSRVALVFSMIGLIFPLTVLLALTTSGTVKDYYKATG